MSEVTKRRRRASARVIAESLAKADIRISSDSMILATEAMVGESATAVAETATATDLANGSAGAILTGAIAQGMGAVTSAAAEAEAGNVGARTVAMTSGPAAATMAASAAAVAVVPLLFRPRPPTAV
jgi:hypothetical protein